MTIDYKKVGSRIARRRKEMKLKQYELCEMIDVNYKYISNLETGRSAPSLETIMKLCDALQTTPDYFLLDTEIKEEGITDSRLLRKINHLDREHRELVDGFIDLLEKTE